MTAAVSNAHTSSELHADLPTAEQQSLYLKYLKRPPQITIILLT